MIIQNAIMITENWPEVFFVVSAHVHDFRGYTFKDGSEICVDGGNDYIRRVGDITSCGINWEEHCLDDTDPFDVIKNKLLWGTRGKDGKQLLKYVLLTDCETSHLQSILKTQKIGVLYKKVIKSILKDRSKKSPKRPVKYKK